MRRFRGTGIASSVVASGLVAVSVMTTSGLAADLPAIKSPVLKAPAALWSWSGLYVGGHIGASLSITDIADPLGAPIYGDNVRSPGFIGGGQIGFNHQVGSVVFGVEADVSGVSSDGTNTCFAVSGDSISSTCRVRADLYTTLTGRIGYAVDRSLFYVKGGAAWTRGTVDMIVNKNDPNRSAVFTSTNSFVTPGWTVGAGVEYALASAWSVKLEYDYLSFRDQDVATPYVPGNPFGVTASTTTISQHVHQFKLGLNYRLADGVNWPGNAAAMPFKAAPIYSPSGWTMEAGARYVYGWGRFQKDHNTGLADGSGVPNGMMTSRITYHDMQSNTSEVFGRINTPWNVFVKGFAGVGVTGHGHNNDEDSFFHVNGVDVPYTNSFSDKVRGHLNYAVADVGYDFMSGSSHKVGAFVGYSFVDQALNRFNCVQIANKEGGSCTAPEETPTPPNVVRFQEIDKWHAMRVGVAGEMMLTDRVKLGGEVAYLPFVHFEGQDNHFRNPILQLPAKSNGGHGVQAEALLSYYVTDRLSFGVGGRYWGLWTTDGQFSGTPPGPPRFYRAAFEQAGVFVQTSYLFGGDDTRTTPMYYKAPSATARNDWRGFYAGIVGGGDWGRSKHIANGSNLNNATDLTSTFHVNGGLLGASAGYNAQFAGMWLFGLEGDMSWSNAGGTAFLAPPFNTARQAGTKESWLATARVRLGVVPVDRWLAYVTGGVALADVKAQIINPDITFTESHIRGDWTVGAGAEVALDRNWSAKLEYLHVGLTDTPYFTPQPADDTRNRGGGVPFNQEIVRGGLSYRLN